MCLYVYTYVTVEQHYGRYFYYKTPVGNVNVSIGVHRLAVVIVECALLIQRWLEAGT